MHNVRLLLLVKSDSIGIMAGSVTGLVLEGNLVLTPLVRQGQTVKIIPPILLMVGFCAVCLIPQKVALCSTANLLICVMSKFLMGKHVAKIIQAANMVVD